jgi:hypothetical protein
MSPRAKLDVKVVLATIAGTCVVLAVVAVALPGVFSTSTSDQPRRAPALTPEDLTGMMPEVVVQAKRPPELMAEVVVKPERPVVVEAGRPATSVPGIY